jgi:hypothetical protein
MEYEQYAFGGYLMNDNNKYPAVRLRTKNSYADCSVSTMKSLNNLQDVKFTIDTAFLEYILGKENFISSLKRFLDLGETDINLFTDNKDNKYTLLSASEFLIQHPLYKQITCKSDATSNSENLQNLRLVKKSILDKHSIYKNKILLFLDIVITCTTYSTIPFYFV